MKTIIGKSEAVIMLEHVTEDTKLGIMVKGKKHVIMKIRSAIGKLTFYLVDCDFMGARTTFDTKLELLNHVLDSPDYVNSKPEEKGAFTFDNGKELLKWLSED